MPLKAFKSCHNSLYKQGRQIIGEMLSDGYGRSKRAMRSGNKEASPAIHNTLTARIYLTGWEYYCRFLSDNHITTKSLQTGSELENLIAYGKYLEDRGYSASTIHTYLSATCKVTGNSLNDLHDPDNGWTLPVRSSADFKRSRYQTDSDNHFSATSAANVLAITLARCAGLRNYKELRALHGDDVVERDGQYYVIVRRGKGGKPRRSIIMADDSELALILGACAAACKGKVCSSVNNHIDIHSYRAEYAAKVYAATAMSEAHLQAIANKNANDKRIYITRISRPGIPYGTVFDRKALQHASFQLGHSMTGRESMIVSCYGYKILENRGI